MIRFRSLLVAACVASAAAAAPSPDGVLRLTLEDAIARGLDHGLAAILARESVRRAQADRDLARGALLPTVTAGVSGSRQEIDLEAYGFPVAPGESPVVGPFNVLDARVYLSQPLLDLAAAARSRAGAEGLEAARFGEADERETVVLVTAGLYLQAAIGARRIESVKAQEEVAKALYERAGSLRESGVVAGIEVLRAKVELESQRQKVILAENELAKEKLALARAIGLPLSTPFELADTFPEAAVPPIDVDRAMAHAESERSDLKRADARVREAESKARAARAQRWPTFHLSADYGAIGPTTPRLERTFFLGGAIRVPLFEGGRIRAQAARDEAEVSRLRAERDDLRARVELDVRSALLDLGSSGDRLAVAKDALSLAEEQLRQSEDRFDAGVAGNLELVQAQDAVATASDNWLSALYAHNRARFAVARAVGGAERTIPTLLSGGDPGHD